MFGKYSLSNSNKRCKLLQLLDIHLLCVHWLNSSSGLAQVQLKIIRVTLKWMAFSFKTDLAKVVLLPGDAVAHFFFFLYKQSISEKRGEENYSWGTDNYHFKKQFACRAAEKSWNQLRWGFREKADVHWLALKVWGAKGQFDVCGPGITVTAIHLNVLVHFWKEMCAAGITEKWWQQSLLKVLSVC